MSKRPRKHEEFTRQTKKRITEKEVIYVSADKFKSLCEKTVQKLFDGARSSTKGVDGNQNVKQPIQKTCSICHYLAVSSCENCTSNLCYDCRKVCDKCMEIVCHDCLEEQPDRTTCINCS